MNPVFVIRCRAVIVHDCKLLVVRHAHNPSYAALPGGHLEFGESPQEALRREIIEELGVAPIIGRLLYINTFTTNIQGNPTQPIEFFFEVTNTSDFIERPSDTTHAHELAAVEWVGSGDVTKILPEQLMVDLAAGKLLDDELRFIER